MARTYDLHALFSREELNTIHQKMAEIGVRNRSAYLRKMALDGYCIRLELKDIKEVIFLLRNATNNLNQYAKQANATGAVYKKDMDELKGQLDEIWKVMKEILSQLSKIK